MTNIVRREIPRFFVATVLLSNGQTRAHKLDISQVHTVEEYCAVVNPWVKQAADVVLGNSDDGFFSLDNPFFFYNVNHVMGIGFHYEGMEQRNEFAEVTRTLGFLARDRSVGKGSQPGA